MNLTQKLKEHAFLLVMCAIATVILAVSIHTFLRTKEPDPKTGISYTHYNNYLIFSKSFQHLTSKQDLYRYYPGEYYDLYKYSPTFALLMAPFSIMPPWPGLFLWNLLNALVLVMAVWMVFNTSPKKSLLAIGFILLELVTSMQNSQSNALMAGLIIFAWLFMEKDRPWLSALFIVLTIYIKIFGLVALALFIFYPKKLKNSLITVGWAILLGILPLMVVSPAELIQQYRSWMDVLGADAAVYRGLSVISWLHTWFGLEIGKNVVVLAGGILLLLPLLRINSYKDRGFRLLFLSSLLVWMVIFNHMAESPTFVIAVSGVAIWFFGKEKSSWLDITLLILVFIFTVLSPTDLFPSTLRKNFVEPFVLKAVPCIFVWVKIQFDLYLKDTHPKFGPSP